MKLKKLSLRQLFSNTKFLVVFSILVAFIFWIVVALEYAPVIENEIKDIPVKIDMNNSVPDKLGLQIFGQSDYTINVTVRGNRYIVGGDLLTADDFEATAQTAYVDSAGKHSLVVKVTAKDANADYEIISKSTDYIEVYFDKYAEKEVEVTPRIISELDDYTADDYMFDKADIIYETKTVKVSGAQTEVNSITAAYADIPIEKKLTQSETIDASVVLSNGSDLDSKYVKINGESRLTVPVTLPVYKMQTSAVSVSFKNTPSDYINSPLLYSISPSRVRVAVLQNGSDTTNSLEIGTIDFANITPSNGSFTFIASNVKTAKFLDGTTSFNVEVNTDGLSTKKLEPNINSIMITGGSGVSAGNVDLSSIGSVTVVGTQTALASVNANMLEVNINLTNIKLEEGENTVPVTVTLKNSKNCWVSGSYSAVIVQN
ncbi:uncharacterized protein conserved in bacteria [Ruminococcus sp. CAG:488]|nr:hypothetical protein [Oscillospiraceae bacterium]CDA20015.1 uncharacterized protein conserved in bacteria [Ruminococcus sp. CAG:488]